MFLNKRKKTNANCDSVYEIWEILEKFGSYQIMQYIYICLPTLFITMGNINFVFVVGDVDYRCRVPECEGPRDLIQVDWWPNETIGRCRRPVLLNGSRTNNKCTRNDFGNDMEACDEWVYENNDSVISELNLACKSWHINSVGTVHNLGMLIATVATGWITDIFGRKYTLIIFMVASSIGVFKVFVTTYYMYIFVEFLEALLGGGSYPAATVLMIEISGKRHRVLSGVLFAFAIYLGETIFATIAMVVPNWKLLTMIVYIPTIFCIALIYVLHESPRWLIVNGKHRSAIENLKLIAKTNNINVNTNDLEKIDAVLLKEKFNIGNYNKKESLIDVFKSKEMVKRLLVASFCRFTSNFVYYGIMVNSVWLPGDRYTNFLLSTVMSFPGELISLYLMNKVGRKMPLVYGFIIGGVLCILSAFAPKTFAWAQLLLLLSGKMVMSACFTGAITYCLELFPTSARASLLGLCAFSARLGGMLAPLTPILDEVSTILPAICFGASSVITGALMILTPETKDMPLLDTIEQIERSVKPKNNMADSKKVYNVETEFTTM